MRLSAKQELIALVLEWVPKGSLNDLLKDPAIDLSWGEPLLRLATDLARGMSYLHGRKYFDEVEGVFKECILHRDLKPDNW
jgi:serine/threonine protein kinase